MTKLANPQRCDKGAAKQEAFLEIKDCLTSKNLSDEEGLNVLISVLAFILIQLAGNNDTYWKNNEEQLVRELRCYRQATKSSLPYLYSN
jgi:hypothetical protein